VRARLDVYKRIKIILLAVGGVGCRIERRLASAGVPVCISAFSCYNVLLITIIVKPGDFSQAAEVLASPRA